MRIHARLVCVLALLVAVTVAVPACGGSAAHSATTSSAWSHILRMGPVYLNPTQPCRIDFQMRSPEFRVVLLAKKPLVSYTLYSVGASDGMTRPSLTPVPLEGSPHTGGDGDFTAYALIARSLKPGQYELALKGDGQVSGLQIDQR